MENKVGLNASATININIGQNEILTITKKIHKSDKKTYKLTKKLYNCKECNNVLKKEKQELQKRLDDHLTTVHKNEKCKACDKVHCRIARSIENNLQEPHFYAIRKFIECNENIKFCYINRDLIFCKNHYKIIDKIAYNFIWKQTINFVFDKFADLNSNLKSNCKEQIKDNEN